MAIKSVIRSYWTLTEKPVEIKGIEEPIIEEPVIEDISDMVEVKEPVAKAEKPIKAKKETEKPKKAKTGK